MTDFPDYQEPQANATALSLTNLVGTGLAREAGGNLDVHTRLLGGTQAGALIANTGLTVGQEVAALIASGLSTGAPGGTPLLHGAKQIYSLTGQVIAANSSFATGFQTVTKPGYIIRITADNTAGLTVTPIVECDVLWQVSASGSVAASEEIWYTWSGNNAQRRLLGKGPTKGDRMQVTFTNADLVNSVTLNVTIWETTQHIARDDWRGDKGVTSTTATTMVGDMLANIIACDTYTVGAGANVARNLPVYSGPASIWINQNAAAGSVVSIVAAGDSNLAVFNPVVQLDWTALPFQLKNIYLPRAPCQVQALNQGAGPVTFSVCIIALENAS